MSKTIYFIRHAKSSWDHYDLKDIERPLNARGLRDAPRMAGYLKELGVQVDAIVASPAKRAQLTADFFQDTLNIEDRHEDDRIYEAWGNALFEVVQSISDDYDVVLLFGHNPAFTNIANQFSDEFIANIPTCGICKIVCQIDKWKDFDTKTGRLAAFYYPKMFK
ncbi:MAG: histidine phosphatase family protein [Bacteroidota bacterium]